MAGPQGRAGSPWCTEPAARPGLAKVSPQSRGWPASLTTVRRQNPKAALDRIGVLGRRLLACCAAPGVPLLLAGRPRPRERRDSPSPDCLSRRTRPQPRGALRAQRTPPPAQRPWEMQSAPRPQDALCGPGGTTVLGVHLRGCRGRGRRGGFAAGGRPSPARATSPALLPRDSTGSRLGMVGGDSPSPRHRRWP